MANVSILFHNVVADEDLEFGKTYRNAAQEDFTVSMFKYYVSNFAFTRADGTVYVVPQDASYFLIDASKPETLTAIVSVPESEYRSMTFLLGVDSLRNTKPVSERRGVLDIGASGGANGMYWTWNSGYIFLKFEGNSPASPHQPDHALMFHIGLFGGMTKKTLNNTRTVDIDFSSCSNLVVKPGENATVPIKADVYKLFSAVEIVRFAQENAVMVGLYSQKIADNYAKMFAYDCPIAPK